MFFDDFRSFGNKEVFIEDTGNSMNYLELGLFSDKLAKYAKPRKLVFCLCKNSIGCGAGYIGFLNNRIVPLMLSHEVDSKLLNYLINIYVPDYLYVPEERVWDFSGYTALLSELGYVLMEAVNPNETKLNDDLGLLLTTSGSTGSAKLVRQSYDNLQTNAEQIAQYLELSSDERPVTTLPMNYCYGLSVINSHILKGATILLTDSTLIMNSFWKFMKTNSATSIAGVPFSYELLKRVRFFKMDLPAIRYMTQAGGKLSPELHREFAEWALKNNKRFYVMYGQTEATARMGYLPADKSLEKYGSIGIPIPGGKFHLIDEQGNEIKAPDKDGELVYHGRNVTLGYATSKDDLAKGDERNGKLETGDIARKDSDGYYYIVGRKKRFLKLFGNRVNLDETDRLIRQQFSGIECASTGTDEKLITYINDKNLIDEVRQYLSKITNLSESAFLVRYISDIPKNESGKILYAKLNKN